MGIRHRLRRVFDQLIAFEEWLFREPLPDTWTLVDYVYVTEKLLECFPFAKLYLADRDYYISPKGEIQEFLALDETDKEIYVSEVHDCDDFSFRLMGQYHTKPYSALAIGIAWSQVHAYNIIIDKDGLVWIIEPQTDELIAPSAAEYQYDTELIIM